jgi:predicted anti-sigma-YlaC factor YlaD
MSDVNCIQKIMLSAYLDGELSAHDIKHVETHLADCADCSDSCERMKLDRDFLLACMPEAVPPEYMKQKLFRKINATTEGHRDAGSRAWTWIRPILPLRSRAWTAACASIMLCAILLSVFQYQRRIEDGKILVQIDRAKIEWASRYSSTNPFNIDAKGAPTRLSAENPFKSYLNEH